MVGILMAFQDFVPAKGLFRSEFVGLKHFTYMFQLPDIGKIIRNTVVIAMGKMIIGMVIAIAFAILLNEIRTTFMKKTIQTIVYLPHFLSWAKFLIYAISWIYCLKTCTTRQVFETFVRMRLPPIHGCNLILAHQLYVILSSDEYKFLPISLPFL